jgi:hypothetical protein
MATDPLASPVSVKQDILSGMLDEAIRQMSSASSGSEIPPMPDGSETRDK